MHDSNYYFGLLSSECRGVKLIYRFGPPNRISTCLVASCCIKHIFRFGACDAMARTLAFSFPSCDVRHIPIGNKDKCEEYTRTQEIVSRDAARVL